MPFDRNRNFVNWNPWHGCTKVSEGCRNCYVYRQDAMRDAALDSSVVRRTAAFDLPVRRNRHCAWKIPASSVVYTCFTSDFLLDAADEWRAEAWDMIRMRRDLIFYFFTKRIERFADAVPSDWGDGWENVAVGCTVENQQMADRRLPVFKSLPIKYKSIIAAPLLGPLDLRSYLDSSISEVSTGGESGAAARVLDFEWVLDIRRQCIDAGVEFHFHQTGARLLKEGRLYRIPRCHQHEQAKRADVDIRCL